MNSLSGGGELLVSSVYRKYIVTIAFLYRLASLGTNTSFGQFLRSLLAFFWDLLGFVVVLDHNLYERITCYLVGPPEPVLFLNCLLSILRDNDI